MKELHGVEISEAYKDYEPKIRANQTVNRLLNGIPKKYLAGLKTVVITNFANLPHDKRKGKTKARGRKVPITWCRGFYYKKWHGEPAWIQLILDNILEPWPKWKLCIPFFRDYAISNTLFHELGHHIHRVQAPQHKEPENVAENWKKWLRRYYFRKRYWYLMPLFFILRCLMKPLLKTKKSGMHEKGKD